ncbi:uncharacterized protein LOC142520188 [Primulina tabacum]|uniref:uncharacterized protein LOC142520188 n=1 Tax=Primulina tabacum TaxID=48773 RepID=UPI003F59767D
MTPSIKFIANNELPEDKGQAQKIKRQAHRFVILNNILYRRSFQGPLFKCLSMGEVDYVLREIHEECCGEHLRGIVLARKAMLAGFCPATLMKPICAFCPFDQWDMDIVGPFSIARAQKKFLLFQGKEITAWCQEMKIIQSFTYVAYPQANCQTEVVNRIIVQALKTRLHGKGKDWVEELSSVLWAYRTTPRAPTQETSFNLVYGFEAVLSVEIGKSSARVKSYPDDNDQSRAMELDLVEEKREQALI